MREALDIHVTGVVQGVGFRPFVYRAAKQNLISGWVLNAVDGVDIHAEGESNLLDAFVIELSENAPAAAQVREIDLKEVPLQGCEGFEIRFSDDAGNRETTLVSPDLATCDDCVRELFDPGDRRYRYPRALLNTPILPIAVSMLSPMPALNAAPMRHGKPAKAISAGAPRARKAMQSSPRRWRCCTRGRSWR